MNTKTACRLDRCCGGARRGGRGRCRSAWPCRARTSLINSAEVVIVGAGLAGLACAQRLARAGLDVLIQPAVRMKPLTTFWHTGAEPPTRQRLLHLDADHPCDQGRPTGAGAAVAGSAACWTQRQAVRRR